MKMLGVILIVAGVLALAYGGFSYTKKKTVLDVGPVEAQVDQKKSVPIPPLVGGASIILGLIIVASGSRGTDRRTA